MYDSDRALIRSAQAQAVLDAWSVDSGALRRWVILEAARLVRSGRHLSEDEFDPSDYGAIQWVAERLRGAGWTVVTSCS